MDAHRNERTRTKCICPVLVPKHTEKCVVRGGFKDRDIQRIIGICVNTKFLYFILWDVLILGGRFAVFSRIKATSDQTYSCLMACNLQGMCEMPQCQPYRRIWSALDQPGDCLGEPIHNKSWEAEIPRLPQTDPATFGLKLLWRRLSRRASNHIQDGSGTSQQRFPSFPPSERVRSRDERERAMMTLKPACSPPKIEP